MRNFFAILILTLLCHPSSADDLAFDLRDIDGNRIQLTKQNQPKLTVVCFLGTECPLAKLYASRLNQLDKEFPGVSFIGVASNHQDSKQELLAYRDRHSVVFPIAKDQDNTVADLYEAQRTPEVFLLDNELQILYRGRIDDQYQPGLAKSTTTRDDLQIAITEAIAGKPVSMPITEPLGCLIGRVKKASDSTSDITFANQVSRLLINHCSECHREGEIGPMSLTEYDEVSGWADMILEVVEDGRMPPWHADPAHGQFTNERRMTTAEKQMIREWVAAGTPLGDESQMPPSAAPVTTEWRLPREPDAVVAMRDQPFRVPANGTVEYQYFVVDPGFKEDKWITAAEILPGDRSVLHHSIVFVRPPDGAQFRGIGWLAAYVPGQSAPANNPKLGRRVPAGSKLVFQQHYTPTGQQASDITRIGLLFGNESEIENEVFTLVAVDQEFVIPPGAANHKVNASFLRIPKQGSLLGISPHMHFRGKSFRMTANWKQDRPSGPSGKPEILLDVPKYDFNWQHIYQLQEPIPLDEIQSLQFTAAFDNSSANAANPNPEQAVTWGDQTWEEMAVAFAIVSEPRRLKEEIVVVTPEQQRAIKARRDLIEKDAAKFADKFCERFDANQDEIITLDELPRSTRIFGHWSIDFDGDGIITKEDIFNAAISRFESKRK